MDESLLELCFFIVSGGAGILIYILKLRGKLIMDRETMSRNRSRVDQIVDTADFETIREELVHVVAENIREPHSRIKLTTDFTKDLNVPPGEMHLLFNDVDESFRIELDRSKIRTFKDLFQQICDRRIG